MNFRPSVACFRLLSMKTMEEPCISFSYCLGNYLCFMLLLLEHAIHDICTCHVNNPLCSRIFVVLWSILGSLLDPRDKS